MILPLSYMFNPFLTKDGLSSYIIRQTEGQTKDNIPKT